MRALETGVADALRFLTILRRARELSVELLRAEWAVYQAWLDLEQACGSPLLVFPEEPGTAKSSSEES